MKTSSKAGAGEAEHRKHANQIRRRADENLIGEQRLGKVDEEQDGMAEARGAIEVQGVGPPRRRVAGDRDGRGDAKEEGLIFLAVLRRVQSKRRAASCQEVKIHMRMV